MLEKFSQIVALAILFATAGPALGFADECKSLWIERNEIFQERGFCFGSNLGKGYFGNEGCTTKSPTLSVSEKTRVSQIKTREGHLNCAEERSGWTVASLLNHQPVAASQPADAASISSQIASWRAGADIGCQGIGSMEQVEKIAQNGSIDAQVYMAWSYWQGNQCGIPKNESRSMKWAQLAANQDDAEAQLALAYYFEYGTKAVPLSGLASEDESFDVGGNSDRIGKDDEQAWNWIVRSANQGYAPAFAVAAHFYVRGKYVPNDNSEAYKLYLAAVDRGFTDGYYGAAGVMFNTVREAYVMKDQTKFDESSVIAMEFYIVAQHAENPFMHRLPQAESHNSAFVENAMAMAEGWMSAEQYSRALASAETELSRN